jgi:serine/threonine-protein kinase HipA
MNGVPVGEWRVDAQGRHTFLYDPSWINRRDARPLSLSMPLQPPDSPYSGTIVESFFDNLLPDSIEIRRRVQRQVGAASTSAFDLLAELGRDCVGAVQLLPAGQDPDNVRTIDGVPLDEAGVAAQIRSAVSSRPLGQRDDEPFRISLAGAQEKTALLWHEDQWQRPTGATPTTHIVKLPIGRVGNMQADLSTSVENEWLCAQIVHQFGLPVAECEIADFEDQHVLVVKRFDRKLSRDGRWWLRLPQEDMCQATGTPPEQRYESDGGPGIAEISSLLLGSRQAQRDRRNFFKAQVVFWMLCAIDGHAKNFSLFIEPHGRYTSTPLYDVMSAYPILGKGANRLAPQKARMAMAVNGKNRHYKWMEIQPRHWLTMAASVGLHSTVREDIHGLVSRTPAVVNDVSERLPAGFPEHVAGPILDGLLESANRFSVLE